jgi:hypothetical protein
MTKVAFEERTMGRTQVFAYLMKFKSDVTYAEDTESSGHKSTNKRDENVVRVKKAVV